MLIKHFSHIFYDPTKGLEDADRDPAKITDIILHIAFLSLIPTVCGYIASVHIGWDLGIDKPFFMAQDQAVVVALIAFISLNIGVQN